MEAFLFLIIEHLERYQHKISFRDPNRISSFLSPIAVMG